MIVLASGEKDLKDAFQIHSDTSSKIEELEDKIRGKLNEVARLSGSLEKCKVEKSSLVDALARRNANLQEHRNEQAILQKALEKAHATFDEVTTPSTSTSTGFSFNVLGFSFSHKSG